MTDEGYRWRWRIKQGDLIVASGDAPGRREAEREMSHYAALYAEEGPIAIETRTGKNRWRRHNP
jgi:hypothetical protein